MLFLMFFYMDYIKKYYIILYIICEYVFVICMYIFIIILLEYFVNCVVFLIFKSFLYFDEYIIDFKKYCVEKKVINE